MGYELLSQGGPGRGKDEQPASPRIRSTQRFERERNRRSAENEGVEAKGDKKLVTWRVLPLHLSEMATDHAASRDQAAAGDANGMDQRGLDRISSKVCFEIYF